MPDEEAYESNLLDLCEDQGLTFEQLGASLAPPVSRSLVSRWSRGERLIPSHRIEEIALKLQTTPESISRSIGVGTRQYQRRQQRRQQRQQTQPAPPPASTVPTPKRPRRQRSA